MSETPDELRARAEDLRDHFTGGACSCMSAEEAADVIEALRARLATAEAERDEWRAMAMAEGVEDLSDCPWFLGTGTCSYGCQTEPSCQTDRPREGWPTEQHPLVIQLREAVARREQP